MIGHRFERLVVVRKLDSDISGNSRWECACDCGATKQVLGSSLRYGSTKSCGCLQREVAGKLRRKHGMYTTRTYSSWEHMRSRCLNENNDEFFRYGGRGITVCERWNDFSAFLADMGPRPEGKTLDRIDGDGNYEPGNCRWATPAQQTGNRGICIFIEYNGRTQSITDWAKELGMQAQKLRWRLRRGWSIEAILGGR